MSNRIHIRIIAVALTLAAGVAGACAAGINKGFFKKAADKVWSLNSENLFVPTKIIPDSIKAGHTAVVIARHAEFADATIVLTAN